MKDTSAGKVKSNTFPPLWRRGVYEAIYRRRDMRKFLPRPIPDKLLRRLLRAAHQAGSVGLMQPWNFLVIRDQEVKRRVKAQFLLANEAAAAVYEGERRLLYQRLTLEAIEEAPVNLAVTCDRSRRGPHVLGRHSIPDTDLYSTVCAVQNLWLAARAEGIGVGWVSILDPAAVARILEVPDKVVLVAYLCMGYVARFPDVPTLETAEWESRLPLESVLHYDRWGRRPPETADGIPGDAQPGDTR